MTESWDKKGSGLSTVQQPAIRFLVESALRTVISNTAKAEPRTREQWIERLVEALMSESDSSYRAVVASLMASGVSTQEIFQSYIPTASAYLGELWVSDRASFVDVTVGASRLQGLFRNKPADAPARWSDRSIPLGQSVLMVVPQFEQHALGAFVAADNLRRHGLWVHMAIGLRQEELAELAGSRRFAMIGISVATRNSVEKTTGLVDYVRSNTDYLPPIVIGGRAVEADPKAVSKTGADFSVRTAREAIEKCGLSSVSEALPFSGVL
ncbi:MULTISPECIES: cobalamin B12-binding domain-containing protein [unclassified Roseovarius]|uniref:cobalamin B12-binding domain-containing protein n=1 Tax=unclassified Roseovarius TaxID=2614913 RepID=UPI00273EF6EB|nr:cobalamin B12-binding domain-containing protein [Roseovarius sp. MMSF_3350]